MAHDDSPGATRALWIAWAALIAASGVLLWRWNDTHGSGQLAELLVFALSGLWFGKLLIFTGLHEKVPLTPWEIGVLSTIVDLHVAFALALGIRAFERVPRIGAWMQRLRGKTRQVLREYPGIRRMAFAGLVTFVFLPIAYTGPITASFAARLMGMSRAMGVLAIALGSLLASAVYAALAEALGAKSEELVNNPWLFAGLFALAALLVWIAWRRVRRELQRR